MSKIPKLVGTTNGIKNKDLIGIPWLLAFSLRADGWYLRSDIIWQKPNPMPESVTDRCTKSHEYIFMLTKSPKYYFDADSIKTDAAEGTANRYKYEFNQHELKHGAGRPNVAINTPGMKDYSGKANKRDVWSVPASGGYSDENGGHYATFPEKLIEPCILAGSPKGGVVLDCFNGAGTTGVVCAKLGREYIGIELNPTYVTLAESRIADVLEEIEAKNAQYKIEGF